MNLQIDPRVKAIFDEIVAHTPELGPTPTDAIGLQATAPGRRSPWLMAAAATIAVVGIGAVALVATRPHVDAPASAPVSAPPSDSPSTALPTSATPGALPTRFPVLDDVPAGLSATALTQWTTPEPTPWTEALIGRPVDGVLTDTVAITVQSQPFDISPLTGHPPADADVFGEPATVYDYGTINGASVVHVTWGSGPYFLVSGAAPLAFLTVASADVFHAADQPDSTQPPLLTFGQLPDGFEVIAQPRPVGPASMAATLSIGADNYDISVSTRNPLVSMSLFGPLRSIEVAGRQGWTFLSTFASQDIAWQVDESTFAYLKINDGTDSPGAVALADDIAFVDWNTWVARYAPDTAHDPTTTDPPAG